MTTARRVIKKIRRKFKPPEKVEDPLVKIIAELKAEEYRKQFWERDKKTKRDENLEKAKMALAVRREAIQAEKDRQEAIAQQRLKNLKKARRKLKKQRSQP